MPLFQVSIKGVGGFSVETVTASDKTEAGLKARKKVAHQLRSIGVNIMDLRTQWIRPLSRKEILQNALERLWDHYPSIYHEVWQRDIKGEALLRRAKPLVEDRVSPQHWRAIIEP